ncbi:MAG: hypothetical protein AAGG01_08705 [Planctomycetota bacterium]
MDSARIDRLRASSFAALGLRCNPFGELDRSDRARVACVSVERFAAHLKEPRRALQLMGDHGRGKSTHLLALHARHYAECAYDQVHLDSGPLAPAPGLRFVDSVENVPEKARTRLFRSASGLAITTHRDHTAELRRYGFEVLTARIGIASLADLATIVEARIMHQELDGYSAPRPSRERLAELHADFGDDVRGIEGVLYADYERLRTTRTGAYPPLLLPEPRSS